MRKIYKGFSFYYSQIEKGVKMETEKVVVILLVISILFSAFAVMLNFRVMAGTSDGPLIGGGINQNTLLKLNSGPPAGGSVGLEIVRRGQ